MRNNRKLLSAVTVLLVSTAALLAGEETSLTSFFFDNDQGMSETVTSALELDTTNPFFQSLGSNDRACVTCHQPAEGWTVTPSSLRRRFLASDGFDPVFRLNDSANCPTADVSSLDARRRAYRPAAQEGPHSRGSADPAERGVLAPRGRRSIPVHGRRAGDVPSSATQYESEVPERRDVGRA